MRKTAAVFLFFQCLFCFEALGSEVYMGSGAAYNISGGNITLWVEEVANGDEEFESGTLKLKLWATSDVYSGGSITGYILGVYNLGTLDPQASLDDIDATVSYDPPPYGSYHITLTLTESNGSGDIITDYANFDDVQTLGGEDSEESDDDSDGGSSCFISVALSGIKDTGSADWNYTSIFSGKH